MKLYFEQIFLDTPCFHLFWPKLDQNWEMLHGDVLPQCKAVGLLQSLSLNFKLSCSSLLLLAS